MRIGMSEHGGRADDPDLRAAPPHTGTFQSGYITAGVCAFSMTSRITQRDGTTERVSSASGMGPG
jgi:hypothetical protein